MAIRKHRGFALGISMAVLIVLLGAGASWAPNTHLGPTELHVFNAFTPDGKLVPGLHVLGRTARGSCWEGAVLDQRPDAWRCTRGNEIFDPCFVNGVSPGSLAACPQDPWSTHVVLLKLTKWLPPHFRNHARPLFKLDPWGVVIASGKRCTMLSGATSTVAGQRINYGCSGGGQLVGSPQRNSSRWTILFEHNFGARQLTALPITAAWW